MILFALFLWLQSSAPVWLCLVHRDIRSAVPGQCSICSRPLEQRHLRSAWSCPMHSAIQGEKGAACPACGMTLVAMTVEVFWTCERHPDLTRAQPGSCPLDQRPLVERTVRMPHGDHNPRHGGILFMAPDGFHHLEGTLSPSGEFRLYLYDDFTRPLDARRIQARISGRPLQAREEGKFLELKLPGPAGFPAEVVVHARFDEKAGEERFDFVFPGSLPAATLVEFRMPDEPEKIIAEILARDLRIQKLIRNGAWTELFIPALEAKDLALALQDRAGPGVSLPVKTLVRAAWLLDMYGDRGNKVKVESAYRLFQAAVSQIKELGER